MINEVKAKRAFYMGLKYIVLILLAYQLLYPVLYMISASIKDPLDSYDPSVIWIPKNFSATGFIDAFKSMKYLDALKGSLEISLGCAVLDVMSCALAGYGFARFKFPFKNLLFACVILTLMVPMQTIILPYYMNMRYFDPLGLVSAINAAFDKTITINLVGKNIAFYLPSLFGSGIRSGLYIYIFRQFFEGMDKALEEAAQIDGCTEVGVFFRVVTPISKSMIAAISLFIAVINWNDYYSYMMFISNKTELQPYAWVLHRMLTDQTMMNQVRNGAVSMGMATPPPPMALRMACIICAMLPIMCVYPFLQKHFTKGITLGAVKE